MQDLNLGSVIPACITPFTEDGEVDFPALASHGRWLASIDGITAIVCNGHAGEGLALSDDERAEVTSCLVASVGDRLPIIAGIVSEGTRVAAVEAERALKAGARGLLVYPSHSWLRFGYQRGAPQDRYRAIAEASGLPLVLFLYPSVTKATYDFETLVALCANPSVIAVKNGVRNMSRWDTETPAIRQSFPHIKMLTCQDEYLLHTMWESDGALVSYAAVAPELMVQLWRAAKAHDYDAAKRVYDRTLRLTSALYHIEPHVPTVAIKIALMLRGLLSSPTVRSPLMPLTAAKTVEIQAGLEAAGLPTACKVAA
jgi:4-hydroxy-tetrahydrodipicolinate synthase